MITPPHLNDRSIFSYAPPSYKPSAAEMASRSRNNNNDDDDKKYAGITDCPTEIHCILPDGIKVENHPTRDGETNWGLYATKLFPKHSVIYTRAHGGYIHDKNVDYKLVIDPESK
ncbi:unnamed protein product [Didymodactylos carnosus]|uniref:Uncharacterized protein n=1 Tax=Didymodactylos carnosus TaxID=1234261 RepID=A0A814ZUX9_9BILA|nr:unnamed protein product [Didymodactylos carnosus]CAF1250328.1 unnamed protein product [Didymodactylos carnosus]CAF3830631.1 unnamed protein product [Didymodactylos carnosus]CAF4019310.1 unnamed protein product [Didymodactylos carnosus]